MNLLRSSYPGDAAAGLVANALIQATVAILLAGLLARALSRHPAARHGVWLCALLGVLLSPAFALVGAQVGLALTTIPLALAEQDSGAASPASGRRDGGVGATRGADGTRVVAQQAASGLRAVGPETGSVPLRRARRTSPGQPPARAVGSEAGWREVAGAVVLIWGIIALALLIRLVDGWRVLAALRRQALPLDGAAWDGVLGHVQETLGVTDLPPIATSRGVAGPIAGGVIRPVVLLPEGLARTISDRQMRDVLVHECAHVVRLDPLVGLLQRLAELLFWPHPAVHFLNRQLARAREEVCDNYALRQVNPVDYARTLLEITEARPASPRASAAFGLSDPRWTLEERVTGLLDKRRVKTTRMNRWGLLAVATALITAGGGIAGVRLEEPKQADVTARAGEGVKPPASKPSDLSGTQVEGIVVDETGQPVAGSDVTLTRPGRAPIARKAARDGTFVFSLDEPVIQLLTLRATADGGARQGLFGRFGDPLVMPTLSTRLVLKPARPLSIRVTDAGGKGVPGAAVEVMETYAPLVDATTDERGLARFQLPADANILWINALKPGVGYDYYENYPWWTTLQGSLLPEQITLVLDGAQTVRIAAVDAAGRPVPEVTFVPSGFKKVGKLDEANLGGALLSRVKTDARGMATFDFIPRGQVGGVSFLAWGAGYSAPESFHFDPAEKETTLTAHLDRMSAITGRATLPDGKPAAGILIRADGNVPGYDRTGADGMYKVEVPPETYIVAVLDEIWAARSRTGVVLLEGKPHPGVDFQLGPGTVVRGKVTRGPKGTPAAGKTVTLLEWGVKPPGSAQGGDGRTFLPRWATTDRDGRYALRVGPGEYQLRDPVGKKEELTIAAEEAIERDYYVPTPPRGPLTGLVVDKDHGDRPVASARIVGNSLPPGNDGHRGFEAVADAEGRFATERWHDSMILYARTADGALAGSAKISREDRDVTIPVSAAATARGRFVDGSGTPVASLRVYCAMATGPRGHRAGSATLIAQTNEEGIYTFPGLPVGARCEVYCSQPMSGTHTAGLFEVEKPGPIAVPNGVIDPRVKRR